MSVDSQHHNMEEENERMEEAHHHHVGSEFSDMILSLGPNAVLHLLTEDGYVLLTYLKIRLLSLRY